MNKLTAILLLVLSLNNLYGQQEVRVYTDSVYLKQLRDSIETALKKSDNIIDSKNLNFKPLANIDYSTRTGLGLSAGIIGEYFTADKVAVQPSSISLEIGYTTNHSHFGEIRGKHFSGSNRWMLDYHLIYSSFNSYFWGIGYEDNNFAENKSEYTRVIADVAGEFRYRVSKQFSLGPIIGFNYIHGKKFTRPDLIEGQPLFSRGLHIGVHLRYDSRDDNYFPTRGINAYFTQKFYPNFIFNTAPYHSSEFVFDLFFKPWNSAVLAIDIAGNLNFCDVPWTLYPLMGGHNRMRGYYRGKYMDKNMITAQAELRQTIFKRSRIVVWGGAGNVFPSFKEFRPDHTLPTFGIGYRLQVHQRLTLRIDYGFGIKGQKGFSVGLKEAF